ncbi:MAG: hypothetical protein KC544_15210 [Gemmatimonadetes bacterium]|nr:hypothetical protein [Gemmatimonadota bacterium]
MATETMVDHGDGTGTRTVYDDDGNVTSTEAVKGLPIPPEPSARERLDALPDEKLARLVDLLEDDTKAAALVDVVEKEATQPRSVSR